MKADALRDVARRASYKRPELVSTLLDHATALVDLVAACEEWRESVAAYQSASADVARAVMHAGVPGYKQTSSERLAAMHDVERETRERFCRARDRVVTALAAVHAVGHVAPTDADAQKERR